jgi:arylformamidase
VARVEIFDVSVPVREGMPHYPDDPGVHCERARSLARGDSANVSRLDFGVHSGTHVDAPLHFLEGEGAADSLPLAAMVGAADVVDATALPDGPIDAPALNGLAIPDDCDRVLLKTRNGRLWELDDFSHDFISLDASGARHLVERGIVLVGIDYLSIGDADAHRVLLSSGVVPLEGLDLRAVEPGRYTLACLPLKLVGADGAPARVVLLRQ